jgi:Cu-Zn family superoxide dismutase
VYMGNMYDLPPHIQARYDPLQRQSPVQTPVTAVAWVNGGPLAPNLHGWVQFSEIPGGTWVSVWITGLPPYQPAAGGKQPVGPHGFHIHQEGNCQVGNPQEPFLAAGAHWNPTNQPHGNHAGDFPSLFSNDGVAIMGFYTNKFSVRDVIGKSVIVHENPDDGRTQPAGNSGRRIACGVITWG